MATRTEPMFDWETHFWNNHFTKQPWLSDYPAKDRAAFELEVEGMVGASIPKDLGSLLRSYHACIWTWPFDPPKNPLYPAEFIVVDLLKSLEVAFYMGDGLDYTDVFPQLIGQVYDCVTRSENGVWVSRPAVPLPFPEENLKIFVQDLKAYAGLTLWFFAREYPEFLASLPSAMSQVLHEELFEIAMLLVLKRLRTTIAQK